MRAEPLSSRFHSAVRSSSVGTLASVANGTSFDHAGSQVLPPISTNGIGMAASRRSASGAAAASGSTAPAISPAPRSRASRPSTVIRSNVSPDRANRPRSTARNGRPCAAIADAPIAAPVPGTDSRR